MKEKTDQELKNEFYSLFESDAIAELERRGYSVDIDIFAPPSDQQHRSFVRYQPRPERHFLRTPSGEVELFKNGKEYYCCPNCGAYPRLADMPTSDRATYVCMNEICKNYPLAQIEKFTRSVELPAYLPKTD